MVNKHLLRDMIGLGIWNDANKEILFSDKGSVQNISDLPDEYKKLYKTVWEISQKVLLDQSADRGVYICQSQSQNIHIADLTRGKLTSSCFYAWKKGLKTGSYYIRGKGKADAIQFVVEKMDKNVIEEEEDEVCESCSG